MANTMKTRRVEQTSMRDDPASLSLPLDTDGLPGLMDAPAVYESILRDLREEHVLADRRSAVADGMQGERERATRKNQRPG